MGYGTNAVVGLSFQNSYGTASGVGSLMYIPFVSENIGLEIPDLIPESKTGHFNEPDSEGGPRTVSGDLSFEPRPVELGLMLKAVFGAAASVVNSGGIYTHVFKPRTSDWDDSAANQPMTIYKDLATTSDAFFHRDLVGSALELSIANGELLKGRVSFVGGTEGTVATQTASYHGGRYFSWDTTSVSLGGAGNADVEQLTILIDEQLEAMHTLNNSKYPSSVKRGGSKRTVSISGTIKFPNNTEYNAFTAQSDRGFILNFRGPTEIQSGYYDELMLKCGRMLYTQFKPSAEGDGEISVAFNGKLQYNASSGTAVYVSLTNTMAAY
jgi:hypothetical protein